MAERVVQSSGKFRSRVSFLEFGVWKIWSSNISLFRYSIAMAVGEERERAWSSSSTLMGGSVEMKVGEKDGCASSDMCTLYE
jgi:hypothetical protein